MSEHNSNLNLELTRLEGKLPLLPEGRAYYAAPWLKNLPDTVRKLPSSTGQ